MADLFLLGLIFIFLAVSTGFVLTADQLMEE